MSTTRVSSREMFLDAGAELVLRDGDISVVSSLSVADLLALAPTDLSRGAFTHHWPTRSEFEVELLLHVATGIWNRAGERTARLFEIVVENVNAGFTLREFVHEAIVRTLPVLLDSVDQRVLVSLWTKTAKHPEVRELLSESWRSQEAELADRLSLLLAVFRVEMRPDRSVRELAAALASLVQVSYLRGTVVAHDDDLAPDLWTNLVVGTIRAYTQPFDL